MSCGWTHALLQPATANGSSGPEAASGLHSAARRCECRDRRGGTVRADDSPLTAVAAFARAACGWGSAASWDLPPGAQPLTRPWPPRWWRHGCPPNPAQRPAALQAGWSPGARSLLNGFADGGPACAVAHRVLGMRAEPWRRRVAQDACSAWRLSWPRAAGRRVRREPPWEAWPTTSTRRPLERPAASARLGHENRLWELVAPSGERPVIGHTWPHRSGPPTSPTSDDSSAFDLQIRSSACCSPCRSWFYCWLRAGPPFLARVHWRGPAVGASSAQSSVPTVSRHPPFSYWLAACCPPATVRTAQ